MIIKWLKLRNYRQHEDLHYRFEGNLIGVLGPNGSGKSHFMDAVEFSFAGRVSGQNKSDMLRWGADEGDVELGFEHDGVDAVIYRELHGTKATFTWGKETFTGISKVNAAVAEKTNLDADICKQAVFVHQKEIDAVLFTEPSVRQLAWQRLCGLGHASKTHSKLGSFISSLPDIADFTEQINEGVERIAEAERALTAAKENLEITGATGTTDIEIINDQIRRVETLKQAINRGVQESQLLNGAHEKLGQTTQELQKVDVELGGYLDDPAELLNAVTSKLNDAVTSLRAIENAANMTREVSDKQAAIDGLSCQYSQEDIDACTETLKRLGDELAATQHQYSLTQSLLEAISGHGDSSDCPLCKQPVSGNLETMAKDALVEAREKHGRAKAAYDTAAKMCETAKFARSQYESKLRAAEQRLAEAKATLAQIERSITMQVSREDVAKLQETAGRHQRQVEHKRDLELKRTGYAGQIKTLNEAISQRSSVVEETVLEAKQLMEALHIKDPSELQTRSYELADESRQSREVREQVAQLNGQIREMEKSLENLNVSVGQLREREAKQAALKSVIDTLAAVREWFHYEHGPQTVINSLLERITSGVNDFLDKFGAGFYAIPDFGTTSFRYWYTDGRPLPEGGHPSVTELSGGEMVVLAVSFRFATYCLFASRIGLLTLDEPTVYLDDGNIGRFCKLLNRVKELAAGMNLQIFISTHEKSVIPFMDTTVKFGTYETKEPVDEHEEKQPAA
jgi:DNA repair exonuclease SbcCD ATPase subunit